MNYFERYTELNRLFSINNSTSVINTPYANIHFSTFNSVYEISPNVLHQTVDGDSLISENKHFLYPIFMPHSTICSSKAILLLHGLNERSWNKYLAWAEYLCYTTNKPVILFPLAYHINRCPSSWSNPKEIADIFHLRRNLYNNDRYISVANVVLSNRISEKPHRFYCSGRQSIADICSLISTIYKGAHSMLPDVSTVDVFAYSIGAFVAEIALLANPLNVFANTKLFLFCGGAVFSSMQGKSRGIMDSKAFDMLHSYYLQELNRHLNQYKKNDAIDAAFEMMVSADNNKHYRENFFLSMGDKIKGVALTKDMVIPFNGIQEALGTVCANNQITQLDFDYQYSHENPFPTNHIHRINEVNMGFMQVFSYARDFFS
jgi:hypothetical protein